MILKSPTSRTAIVNLFADFILSKIPHNKHSIIQVADCINFFVIKGKTSYGDLLNIGEILDEFKEKFNLSVSDGRKLSHTINLIEYNVEMTEPEQIIHTYYNTTNCTYNHTQIENFISNSDYSYTDTYFTNTIKDDTNLIVTSEFPHGYSLSQGRLFYYYGKFIMYNIPTNYPTVELTMGISKNEDKFFVYDGYYKNEDPKLRSAILDMFDFDMTWIESELKKVDWFIEVTNPLSEYDFLNMKIKDFLFT
jgi:hypothetical protein